MAASQRLRACRQFFARMLQGAEGNSVVEYAVLLALVTGCAVAGVALLGSSARHALNQLAHLEAPPAVTANPAVPTPSAPAAVEAEGGRRVAFAAILSLSIAVISVGSMVYTLRQRRLDEQFEQALEHRGDLVKPKQEEVFLKRQHMLNVLMRRPEAMAEEGLLVRDVMTAPVTTVSPETPLDEVREIMKVRRFRHMLVCSKDGAPVGLISDRDLKSRRGKLASDIMNKPRMSVQADDRVGPAITWMINERVSCLPVIEDQRLLGILTTTDIMLALQCFLHVNSMRLAAATAQAEPTPVG